MPDTHHRDRESPAWAAAWAAVAASAVAAVGVHAVAVAQHHAVPWTHLVALVAGWAAGRRSVPWALGLLCGAGALWPALSAPVGILAVHLPASGVAAVLGWLLASPRRLAWHVPRYWRWPLVSWALVVAVSWPLVVARELDFSVATLTAVTQNHLAGLTPADTCVLVAAAALALLTSLLLLDALWPEPTPAGRHIADDMAVPIGVTLAVSIAAALYQVRYDLSWMNTPFWIGFGRAPGLVGDPNVLGAAAALVGPMLAMRAWQRGGRSAAWVTPFWAALSLSGVLASGSRTALAGWAIAMAGQLVASIAGARHRRRAVLAGVVTVVIALLIARAAPLAPGAGNALARAFATLTTGDLFTAAGARFVLLDRYGYGPAAVGVIAAHPAWGVGIGTGDLFMSEYSERHLGKPLLADNAQNWWRQVLVELGAVGGSAALAASVAPLFALLALWRRAGAITAIGYAGPVVGAGAMLLVSVPTQHPFIQLLMAWLLVMTTAPPGVAAVVSPGVSRRPLVPAILALVAAVGVVVTVPRPPERAHAAGRSYGYGNLPADPTPPPGALWIGRRAVGVAPASGRTFVIEASLPHQDLARAPVDVVVSDRRAQSVPLPRLDTGSGGVPPHDCAGRAGRPGAGRRQPSVADTRRRPWRARRDALRAGLVVSGGRTRRSPRPRAPDAPRAARDRSAAPARGRPRLRRPGKSPCR